MRKLLVLAVLAGVLIGVSVSHAHKERVRREASYQAAIAPFRRDLPLGKTRAEVEKYLDARNVQYSAVGIGHPGTALSYLVQIGEEPTHNLFCEDWRVYIAMDFSPSSNDEKPQPNDSLKRIYIDKVGTCL